MQSSFTHRARWPWWLVTMLAVGSAAMWWQPWRDDAPAPAPVPAPKIVEHLSASDVCTSSASSPIEPATPLPALRLVGTVMARSGGFAMVRHMADSRLLQLRVGDRVDGLAVTTIESHRIVLAGAAGSVAIEAETQAVPAPAAIAPAVVAPQAAAAPVPRLIPLQELPAAYRGPAPEDEVLGH